MAIWTWNPSDKSAGVTLSNGNLTATRAGSGWGAARGVSSFLSGKWYWEITVTAGNINDILGIGTSSAALTYPGNDVNGWGFGNGGYKYHNNSAAGYGLSYTNGDIIGAAFDTVAGKIWWSKNGAWLSGGDPAAGTGEAYSGITGTLYPMAGLYTNGNAVEAIFRETFLTYTPPTGFSGPGLPPVAVVPDDWANRIRLFVRNDIVDSDLTDFPVMINLSDSSGMNREDVTDVFDKISDSDRKKIAITSANGTTQQFVEIESWDSTLEKAILWTKCPTLYSSSSNTLYLYYDPTASGNDDYVGDTGEASATYVWDNSFVGVWHMPENGGPYKNSTSTAGIDGTGTPAPTRVTSHIGYAQDFDTDIIEVSDNDALDMTTEITMECMFNIDSWDTSGATFVGRNTNGYIMYAYTDGRFGMGKSGADEVTSAAGEITTGTDYYAVGLRKASDGNDYLYLDGKYITSAAKAAFSALSDSIYIGENKASSNNSLIGTIDEVRLSNTDRSEEYIKANQYNLNDNFVLFETTSSGATWLDDWAKRIEITIDSSKVDEDLFNYPLLINLASGTGITNQDVTDVFDELTTVSSGTIDSYTKLLLHPIGDISDSNHDITINGNPDITTTAPTGFNHSFYFDASGDYLSIPDHTDWDFGSDDWTIEFWYYGENTSSSAYLFCSKDGNLRIAKGGAGTGAINIYYIPLNEADNWYVTTETVTMGTWIHLVITRENNNLYVYINGTKATSGDSSACTGAQNLTGWDIGRRDDASYYMKGYISEIRVSDTARWTANFTSPTSPYTTASGIDSNTKLLINPYSDASSTNSNITFNGEPDITSTAPNNLKNGIYLDGSSDYLVLPSQSYWELDSSESWTIDFWMYKHNDASDWDNVISCAEDGGSYRGWMICFASGADILRLATVAGGAEGISTSQAVANGAWHHYAFVHDNDTDSLYLFVDGALDTYSDTASLAISWTTYAGDLYIGVQPGYAGSRDPEISLSEIRISKGIARWVKDFTPPVNRYPNYREVVAWEDKKFAITESDGLRQQYVEIEDWNPYTEQAWLWTKVPFISKDVDTTMYLYYDSTQANNTTYVGDIGDIPARLVWDDAFQHIWHLSQSPAGGSSAIKDSTANLNHGTSGGTMTDSDRVNGKIDGAIEFDGSDDYILLDNADMPEVRKTVDWTVEFIFNTTNTNTGATHDVRCSLLSKGDGVDQHFNLGINTGKLVCEWYYPSSSNSVLGNSTVADGEWYYGAFVSIGGVIYLYVNGAYDNATGAYNHYDPCVSVRIGDIYDGAGTVDNWGGDIDEGRVSNIARPAAHIKANYYNYFNDLITFDSPTTRPAFVFTGYVKVYGVPAERTVYLYRRSTGEFVGSTASDPSTGYFEIPGAHDEYHFVAILPLLTEDFDLLSRDKLHPTE